SRLVYGMARQNVLPRQLGAIMPARQTPWVAVIFTTVLSLALIAYVTADPDSNVVGNLSNVTAFLLLCVFAIVNVACVVLRRPQHDTGRPHFSSPGQLPILAAVLCLFLAGPWVDRDAEIYKIAGGMLVIGVVLW